MKTSERVLEFLKQQGFCPEVDPNNGNIFFKYQILILKQLYQDQ
jgi:hypothetical protein